MKTQKTLKEFKSHQENLEALHLHIVFSSQIFHEELHIKFWLTDCHVLTCAYTMFITTS